MDVQGMEDLRNGLSAVIDRAAADNVPTLITRRGRPVAVVISVSMWQSTGEADSVALALLDKAIGAEGKARCAYCPDDPYATQDRHGDPLCQSCPHRNRREPESPVTSGAT